VEDFETTQRALLGPKQKSEIHRRFASKPFSKKVNQHSKLNKK